MLFHAVGQPDPLLISRAHYITLGATPAFGQKAYRAFFGRAISEDQLALIRQRPRRQHALGSDRFRALVEAQLIEGSRAVGGGAAEEPVVSCAPGGIRL